MSKSLRISPAITVGLYLVCAILFGIGLAAHVAFFGKTSPAIFLVAVVVLYFISQPKYSLSPENLIFLYYAVWYGISPLFATRFYDYGFDTTSEINAYYMLYFTYSFSLFVLLFFRMFVVFKFAVEVGSESRFLSRLLLLASFVVVVISLYAFVMATGGLQAWLLDAKMAFISRSGSGIYYLLYTHSLVFFAAILSYFLYARGGGLVGMAVVILFVILMYPFIGSKLKLIMLFCLVLSPFLVRSKLYSFATVFSFLSGVVLILLGLYLRNSSWMTVDDMLPYFLNYFNTLEMFVLLLNDFEPDVLLTAFLPVNKILSVFDGYIGVPYHDISVWLTSIYYPSALDVGATEQWPIEADFYLSFLYWGGMPFLALYLLWLSYLHQGARTGNLAFCTIYILEFFFIISHYRGGIFLWWYYYLVPFYAFVFLCFRNYNFFCAVVRKEEGEF